MLVNQTVGRNNRRVLRTNTDSSLSLMKKTKKQRQDLSNDKISHRRKLRSSNTDSTDNRTHRQQTIPIKKERKKRMKKIINQPEQEITITQSIEAKTNSNKDVLDTIQIKQEDDIINNCSLLDSPSLSHPIFDSIIDHNQFWHHNQIITPTGYYLPVNSSSPYDHQSNTSYHLSPSDIDNSNSSIHDNNTSKITNNNNNNGQSRKDKSLGLLCQR
jgi:hypothetical protein